MTTNRCVRVKNFLRRPPRGETLRGQIDALVDDHDALIRE
jgi:hypothetical protein